MRLIHRFLWMYALASRLAPESLSESSWIRQLHPLSSLILSVGYLVLRSILPRKTPSSTPPDRLIDKVRRRRQALLRAMFLRRHLGRAQTCDRISHLVPPRCCLPTHSEGSASLAISVTQIMCWSLRLNQDSRRRAHQRRIAVFINMRNQRLALSCTIQEVHLGRNQCLLNYFKRLSSLDVHLNLGASRLHIRTFDLKDHTLTQNGTHRDGRTELLTPHILRTVRPCRTASSHLSNVHYCPIHHNNGMSPPRLTTHIHPDNYPLQPVTTPSLRLHIRTQPHNSPLNSAIRRIHSTMRVCVRLRSRRRRIDILCRTRLCCPRSTRPLVVL